MHLNMACTLRDVYNYILGKINIKIRKQRNFKAALKFTLDVAKIFAVVYIALLLYVMWLNS